MRLTRHILVYALIPLVFAADRISKWWAAAYLAQHGPVRLHALVALRASYNRGLAFGLFQGVGPLVGWLSILIAAGLFLYLRQLPHHWWLMRTGLALIIGGALGNMVDRVTTGQVLDFIETPLRPGIFNIADLMINLGALLCLAGMLWQQNPVAPPALPAPRDMETAATRAADGDRL